MNKYIKGTLAAIVISVGLIGTSSAADIYSIDKGYLGKITPNASGGVDVWSNTKGSLGSINP